MRGCLGGCIGRLVGLALLVAVLLGAWLYRDRILDLASGWRGEEVGTEPSEALADSAEAKLASLTDEPAPERVAFGQAEVQSLIAFRIGHALPPYLIDPRITIDGDAMRVNARVPKEAMPELPGAGELTGLLPDTTDVTARATLLPLDSGRVAIAVDEMSAAKIPLPERMVPALLRRIGRTEEKGLPADAIAMRLPSGACSAYIRSDSLVLLTNARGGGCR